MQSFHSFAGCPHSMQTQRITVTTSSGGLARDLSSTTQFLSTRALTAFFDEPALAK